MGVLNYDTILSAYDDKLTLMQWLKKVEKALNEAAATSFKVNKKGNATISFSIVFEDGSELESGDIVLQQGESVAAARIENGHLILTLTNGDELDAGNLFNGNVNIAGNVSITGDLSAENITGDSIIENMEGYLFNAVTSEHATIDIKYAGCVKSGNEIKFVLFGSIINLDGSYAKIDLARFTLPQEVYDKLYPFTLSPLNNVLDLRMITCIRDYTISHNVDILFNTEKTTNNRIAISTYISPLSQNLEYIFRYEVSFLLSENLAQ